MLGRTCPPVSPETRSLYCGVLTVNLLVNTKKLCEGKEIMIEYTKQEFRIVDPLVQ